MYTGNHKITVEMFRSDITRLDKKKSKDNVTVVTQMVKLYRALSDYGEECVYVKNSNKTIAEFFLNCSVFCTTVITVKLKMKINLKKTQTIKKSFILD